MGEHNVHSSTDQRNRAEFIKHLLDDIKALEIMIEQDLIEKDIVRIGAEQEFCLVNSNWRPAKNAEEILKAINDTHFTTELAKYNLEINLDPLELKKDCFSQVENELNQLLTKAKVKAAQFDTKIVLTGILPTIRKRHLELEYMTSNPRYSALNDTLRTQRGTDFELHIRNVDELSIHHNSVLFEACNTSFQMHLQIPPQDFVSSYNWAQAISGPVLGLCTNSPLLFGRELWSETRIALFRQSMDIRSSSYALKDRGARVSFSNEWASGSVVEIFKNDIAQHRVVLSRDIATNSLSELKKGNIPKLQALSLHNGTVYRWNRPCYGVGGGKAHVRIENRYIPSGPTTLDEIANFAFWAGLMIGRPSKFDNMSNCMDFRDAKGNFIKAARNGKDAILSWMGSPISIQDLVIKELLPIAYSGLEKANVDTNDIERFLGIIEKRAKGITASDWNIRSYRSFQKNMKKDDALRTLTETIYQNQQGELPGHEWPILKTKPSKKHKKASLVGHIMSTKLFTVDKYDLANLATSIMKWKNIHHVPVENKPGKLCGLLTWNHVKNIQDQKKNSDNCSVSDIMVKEVITVQPKTTISKAIQIMKKHEIGCLPVIQKEDLVGIITIKDIIAFDHGTSL
ncbi:CBS domain protein [Aquimarina sp. MAR_2010_214]|uniref:CBS domain-containing protein n=1 Tax=Aquimarina sp. MAR_2010_214 TaxID=1250026 RepID=UPI000C706925|nr:CBS domain-containing protein [Aquimarina sp. MAR_2010_214]PKV51859.1 CBS domain protein [Aquimarina sp. MAR_2010_214]